MEIQRAERRVVPGMRSAQEGRPSLQNAEAVPEDLPGEKTDARSSGFSLTHSLSTDSSLLESFPGSQAWENVHSGSMVACVSNTQPLETRVAKAEAWETQAREAQRRGTQPKQTLAVQLQAAQPLKRKPSIKMVKVPEKKKKSEAPFTRPLWSNKVEYILAQVGYSVRAINLWRFPYLWLHNGGWSFFIIYIFLLLLIGIPLLFLEMAVGQRMRQGSIGMWKTIGPWVGGLGCTSFMVCFIAGLYLNVFNTWILTYLGQSFKYSIPWEHCPLLKNSSVFDPECEQTTPSMYFWYRTALKVSDRIEDGGPPVLSLCVPFLLSWCLVGAFMINGIKSIGKVMYVLVPVPYLIMICFLIRVPLLEGAVFGLGNLKVLKISSLYDVHVWCHAGVQVLFSLGLGFGPIVSLSSYMDPSNNCLNDAFVVAAVNLGSLMLATPSIFCVLGFWATVITHRCNEKNAEALSSLVTQGTLPADAQPPANLAANPTALFSAWLSSLSPPISGMVLSHVAECNLEKQLLKVKEGPNFAFLAFIEAMSFAPGSVFWTILYFLMLLTLGLNVMIGTLQSIITPLQDSFSSFRKYPKLFTVAVFVLMFLCGLFFIRPSGVYYVGLLSEYWMILPIITIVIFENMAVGWAYGARRFLADLATLWDHSIHPVFHWLWNALTPAGLLILFIATLILLSLKTMTYPAWDSGTSKEVLRQYPSWVLLAMVILFLIAVLPVPTYFVYCLAHGVPCKSTGLDRPAEGVQRGEPPKGGNRIADPPAV